MALTQRQVSELYVSIFGRASEGEGNKHWQQSVDAKSAANEMLDTPAAKAYFGDSLVSNQAFVEHIYKNTLNKTYADDKAGIDFWTSALNAGTPRGEIVAEMIKAISSYSTSTNAKDKAAYDQFNNRVDVSDYVAGKIEKVPANGDLTVFQAYNNNTTNDVATKNAQIIKVNNDVAAASKGQDFELTSGTDKGAAFVGTAKNDFFDASIAQNAFTGGVSNTLSSADKLDGGAGTDTLHAEIVAEFVGATSGDYQIDVQPQTKDIENVTFEARDAGANGPANTLVTVDAKYMYGVEKIGSKFSDGDLVIENLTTLADDGETIRHTKDMTITMDHTDDSDHDSDASDLKVLFDEDYLNTTTSVSGSTLTVKINNVLNIAEGTNPVENFTAINFTVGTTAVSVNITGATTYAEVVSKINAQLVEQGLTTVSAALGTAENVAFSMNIGTYKTGDIAGTFNPIVITNTGSEALVKGTIDLAQGQTDGDINNTWTATAATELTNPISIKIELEKVGRDGDGGDLIVGAKGLDSLGKDTDVDQKDGIEIFNITVKGDDSKPSNLGNIASTNNYLTTVNIASETRTDDSYADLTVRNLLGEANQELEIINAAAFKGDFSLAMSGAGQQAITSTFGIGDDSYKWQSVEADNVKSDKAYSIDMGAGDDTLIADLDGDSVDALGESFAITTGTGDDTVTLTGAKQVSDETTLYLDNVNVTLGAGEDKLNLNTEIITKVNAGSESDFVVVDADNAVGNTIINSTGTAPVLASAQVTTLNTVGTLSDAKDTISVTVNGVVYTQALGVLGSLNATVDALAVKINADAATLGIASAIGDTNGLITITGLANGSSFTATNFVLTDNDATIKADVGGAVINTTAGVTAVPASADYFAGSVTANGTVGTWQVGTGSESMNGSWDARVLYEATLTVDFAGFEQEVTIVTTAANNFVATQEDINNAIIAAIEANPELSRLLTTKIGKGTENNQILTIKSTVQGVNDLTISVNQPTIVAAASAVTGDTTISSNEYAALEAGLMATTGINSAVIGTVTPEADLIGQLNLLDGNLNQTGAVATDLVLDSVNGTDGTNNTDATSRAIIDMSTGANDLVALDSDKDSMDTLVFSDDFGKVSVVNFDGTSTQTPAIPAESEVQTITFGAAGDLDTQGQVSITILGTTITTTIATGDTAAQVANKVAAAISAGLPVGLSSAVVSGNDLVLTYANTLGDIANATVTSILTDTTASVVTTTAHVNGTNSAPATKEIVVLNGSALTTAGTITVDGQSIPLVDTDGNGTVSAVEFATQVAAFGFTNYNVVNTNETLGLVMLEAKTAGTSAMVAPTTGTAGTAPTIAASGTANDGTSYTTANGTNATGFSAGTAEVQTITITNGADQDGTVTMGIDIDSDGTIRADENFTFNITAGNEGSVARQLAAQIDALAGVSAAQGAAGGTIDDIVITWAAHVDGTATLNPAATTYTDGALRSVSVVETNKGVLFQAAVSETLNGDILDFTAFLTNQLTSSGSTASAVDKATTLNYINAAGTFEVTGNDVLVMNDFVSNGTETFANLTAEALLNSIKNDTLTTNDHGNLSATTLQNGSDTATLLGTTIKSILMVESDINDGEYKVFELTASETTNEFTDATLLGTIDFGETQTTLTDNNIA